jgi:RimJ/RimL family protein N-acetyltransferase
LRSSRNRPGARRFDLAKVSYFPDSAAQAEFDNDPMHKIIEEGLHPAAVDDSVWINRTAPPPLPPHIQDVAAISVRTTGHRRLRRSPELSEVGVTVTAMRLELMTAEDVELKLRTETDPGVMAELGGPRPPEDIKRAHAKSLVMAAEGRCWPLKVIADGSASAAGSVAIFESSHKGEPIYEIGWMVLPEFQNRGIAGQAVRMVLDKARAGRKFGRIHAFPAVTNGPSNKICEKNGFVNLGECVSGFAGRTLRCNHWRIELF